MKKKRILIIVLPIILIIGAVTTYFFTRDYFKAKHMLKSYYNFQMTSDDKYLKDYIAPNVLDAMNEMGKYTDEYLDFFVDDKMTSYKIKSFSLSKVIKDKKEIRKYLEENQTQSNNEFKDMVYANSLHASDIEKISIYKYSYTIKSEGKEDVTGDREWVVIKEKNAEYSLTGTEMAWFQIMLHAIFNDF